ncbi:NAD(P)H-dependent glycerol-3-phosphate dehydrogenase, partial [Candidatus Babeliales bacterium]|nr:NAD(P)H-dependent glycerol-3-phosphate dehydrogenase [Candidatus Babeliales bacterium]
LPGIELDKKVTPTASIQEALAGTEIVFEAIPVLFLREVIEQVKPFVSKDQAWVSLSKGIEQKTLQLPAQVIKDVLGDSCKTAVLGGPNFAQEVAQKHYSAATIASQDEKFAAQVGTLLSNDYFRSYISSDEIGIAAGGALKNVLSVFLGIIIGAGYSRNTISFLFTCALDEMAMITEVMGGKRETAYGLSGLGDLILSGMGEGGRNQNVGKMIGQGTPLNEIASMMPVLPEGINATRAVKQVIQKLALDVPICLATYQIVFEGKSCRVFVDEFMKS